MMAKKKIPYKEPRKEQLFSSVAHSRLAAVSKVVTQPKKPAITLLCEGLEHWDIKLRKSCATALTNIMGSSAVKMIIKSSVNNPLPKKLTSDLLLKYDRKLAIKYLE